MDLASRTQQRPIGRKLGSIFRIAGVCGCFSFLSACSTAEISGNAIVDPPPPQPPHMMPMNPPVNPPPMPEPFVPGPAQLPRLTVDQYRNSVVAVFGAHLPKSELEADQNPYLFYNIGATSTTLSEVGTQQYMAAAIQIGETTLSTNERVSALLGCAPARITDGCVDDFIWSLGRKLFRRPLSVSEFEAWQNVARSGASDRASDRAVTAGLRDLIAGMLQSPSFLYRVELGEPDPEDATRLRYSSYEMASRMSFLLWNQTPDEALLSSAESGALVTNEGLRAEAERMLADPKARGAVQAFFAQYFDLNRLNQIERDPQKYPGFTETMPKSMRKELELLVDDFVFRQNTDIRGLFNTRRSFVNEELANLYGLEVPGASPIAYAPVEFPSDSHRAGLLTLGAFLTMNAHPSETSPTLRGKYVRERVLCQSVPVPPDDVDLNLDDPTGGMPRTLRERLDEHRENPACAGCHSFIDPPGFLFENYDSVGRYRTHEGEYEIDASGSLDGTDLKDAEELAPLLSKDPRVGQCMVLQLYRHAQGRLELPSERGPLFDLVAAFERNDYRFQTLLLELVLSEGFRTLALEVSE